jgi:hypothetical protein
MRNTTGNSKRVAPSKAKHKASMVPSSQIADTKVLMMERAERAIFLLRGRRVILDSNVAALYGVTVSRFNEQVKRNAARFPADFAFQLTREEYDALRSQIAISKTGHRGGRQYLPYAFTEHGAVMAASVLSSPRAIGMSVDVVRAFVHLRALAASHHQVAAKLRRSTPHSAYRRFAWL